MRRILGFWTAWLPKMDLTQPTEQELHDSNYQAVGMLRLFEAKETDTPRPPDERRFDGTDGDVFVKNIPSRRSADHRQRSGRHPWSAPR